MFIKGLHTLIFSLLLHTVILLLLNNSRTKIVPESSIKATPIKSYIYHPPKVIPVEISPEVEEKKILPLKETVKEVRTPIKKIINQNDRKPIVKATIAPTKIPETPATQSFSYKSLDQLREKLKQQENATIQQAFKQPNTSSFMHKNPTLVPHSKVKLSKEEKTKQATLKVGPNRNIIKGDDGSCLLVEDLSAVGIEGVTAVSGFSCGESKFNKSFREHMNKVRKKLGKE